MDYKSMNSFLLLSILLLAVLLYLINRRNENFDVHPENNMKYSMEQVVTTSNNTNENPVNREPTTEIDEFDLSVESMFKNLEKAEQYCDDMESRQDIREKEERQKIQEIAKQQFNIQQRKIQELKRVVEYLKKQQKFKSEIRNKCQAATQFELNKDTQTSKILAEGGLLDSKKTVIEVNVSDKLNELLKDKPPYNRNSIAETFTNQNDYKSRPPRYSYDACPSVDTDKYVNISQLANKCYGCNPYSLIEHSNYIRKDFQ